MFQFIGLKCLLALILFSPFVQFGWFLSINNYFPCGVLTPTQLALLSYPTAGDKIRTQ